MSKKKNNTHKIEPKALYEKAPIPVFLTDSDLVVNWQNECAEKQYKAIIGKTFFASVLPANFAEMLRGTAQACETYIPIIRAKAIFLPFNDNNSSDAGSTPGTKKDEHNGDDSNNSKGYIINMYPTDSGLQAENFWMSSNLISASPDRFKNCIDIIFSNLLLLRRNTNIADDYDAYEQMRSINTQCFRLLRDSQNLGLYMSLNSGEAQLNLQIFDIAQTMRDMCTALELEFRMRAKNITLQINIPSGEIGIVADLEILTSALFNIIGNSIKHGFEFENFEIKITLQKREDDIIISISDNGPGIPMEYSQRIYEPFFTYMHEEYELPGFGLGLAVANGVVKLHGGTIFTSSLEDGGMNTTIILPKNQPFTMSDFSFESSTPPYRSDYYDRYSPMHILLSDKLDPPMP